MGKRIKTGFFSFTSCSGCEIIVINSDELFGELSKIIEIKHLPIIEEKSHGDKYDLLFIEGAITEKEQIKKLKDLRKKTKFLVAFGTCATLGGISAIKECIKDFAETKAFKDFSFLDLLNVKGISEYVKVDYFLKGCPPVKEEFTNVIKTLKEKNKMPEQYEKSVCVECRARKNPCLLAKGKQCLGPVSCGGCNALCTSKGIVCYGCRGPVEKANIDNLVKMFESRGITHDEIFHMFITFAGTSKGYQNLVKKWEEQ